MTRVLNDFKTAIGVDLGDTAEAVWNDTSKDRAVARAVADLSRFRPRELVAEFWYHPAVDDESVTTESAHGTYKALAYKPIKKGSVTVTNAAGTTTYTEHTDYTINYTDGKITTISGGAMAVSTAYLISYYKSDICIDISSLTGRIRVTEVEKIGSVPQERYSFHEYGDLLFITGLDNNSQDSLATDAHILVYYDAVHTPPSSSAGSFPEFMDETVRMLASAYCLFEAAVKRETQSVTDIASARTSLGSATTAQTAVGTALTSVKKYLDGNTAVDAVGMIAAGTALQASIATAITNCTKYLDNNTSADAEGMLTGMSTDLTALDTHLTNMLKYLNNNTSADAAGRLAAITTDAASLRTAVNTALDALNAYIDTVGAAGTGDVALADAVNLLLDDYANGAVAPSAKRYLTDGEATLNTVNVGGEQQEVPLAYAKYSELSLGISQALSLQRDGYLQSATARTNAAMAYMQEASQRLTNLQTYIKESETYIAISSIFTQAAMAVYNKLTVYISKSERYQQIAETFLAEGKTLIEQIQVHNVAAESYVAVAKEFSVEAETRLHQIELYISTAQRYLESSGAELVVADRYRQEAIERRDEVWGIWRDRKEYIGNMSSASVRQMPQYNQ